MNPLPSLSSQSPWPGLRAFGEDDRGFFFGRERETADLLALVQRAAVVVLYGQSGLGKTSLLQAGLFHAVRDASLVPLRVRLDHSESAPELADQIKTALAAALDAAEVSGPRPAAHETLWEYFHRRDVDLWGPRNRLVKPVIVLDQFEEVFTLGQRSDRSAARVAQLAGELEALLEHRPPDAIRARLEARPEDALRYDFQRDGVKFVITLREDFLAQLDAWRTRMPSLVQHRFRLERMTGAQALDVVQRAGQNLVDPAVAKEIVDFVSRSQRRIQAGALQQRDVEPALLSVVCDELNRRRLDKGQARITADLLSGEREGIIQAFYDRAFDGVEPAARDWIEDELLTGSGYRDRAALEDALKLGVREADVDRLVDRRIVHREERDGVVWLELTHDLLTDPAFASRTQRQQRRLAGEAARREAETAQRLRRTSRLAAVFGVLFLATVVALFFAFRMSNRAAEAQASMQTERDKAKTAESNAGAAAARAEASAATATAEADRASSSFATAMGMAEPLGQTLREFVQGDMRLQTPAVLEIIGRADDSYRLLEAQDASQTADRRASFLMTAAQALGDVGHLTESVARAEQALAILDAEGSDEVAGRRALRAEGLYARGAALAATGHMAQARRDYGSAIVLAQTEAKAAAWTVDLERVDVLSELGLGELDRWGLANPSAEAHYQRVLTLLSGRQLHGAEQQVDTWRVQALIGLGSSATDSAEQDRRYARADAALQRLAAADPDNLRLLKLSADLEMLRGWTDSQLDRTWLALKFAEQGATAGLHLTQHDRDNLQWKLTWIRTQRVVGTLDRRRGRWSEARTVFESADSAVAELVRAEPAWRQARYVRGTMLWERAETDLLQKQQLDRVVPLMQQSRVEFEAGIRKAPGDLEFIRAVTLAIGGMAEGHLANSDYDDVIQLSKQAIQALAPAERGANTDPAVLSNKAYYLGLAGQAWVSKKNWKEATDAYASRVSVLEPLAARTRLPADETALAGALADLGRTWWSAGDATKAAAQFERASGAVARALAVSPADSGSLDLAVYVHRNQAALQLQQGDHAAALDHLQAASTLTWSALKGESWNSSLQNDLIAINDDLDRLKTAIGKAGPPSPQAQALLARLNPLIADRQVSKLVDWVIRPVIPGAWVNLADIKDDLRLTAARRLVVAAYPRLDADQVFAVRVLPLSFRKDADALYEAGIETDHGDRGIVTFILKTQSTGPTDPTKPSVKTGAGRFVLLDGTASPVHEMNSESAPVLDTVEHAAAYFRFFLGVFQSNYGPFAVVERAEDVLWRPDAPASTRADVRKLVAPLRLTKQSDGSWSVDSTLTYGDALLGAQWTISPSGSIADGKFKELAADLPVQIEYLADSVKTLRDISAFQERILASDEKQLEQTPKDRKVLTEATELSAKLGRWKEAAATQQRVVDVIRADPAAKDDLPGAYVSLSWYQLFARDFAGALASTLAAPRPDPANLYIETNHAHALLFLGRVQEAEAIYRAHIGQKIRPGSDRLWEQAILQDFDDLEKAQITHPEIARIRRLMKSG